MNEADSQRDRRIRQVLAEVVDNLTSWILAEHLEGRGAHEYLLEKQMACYDPLDALPPSDKDRAIVILLAERGDHVAGSDRILRGLSELENS